MKRIAFGLAQAAVCGLVFGLTMLFAGHLWTPQVAQATYEPPTAVIKAQSFQLVNAAGQLRADLTIASDNTPVLNLYSTSGSVGASLQVHYVNGARLMLYDPNGVNRAALTVQQQLGGRPGLAMYDAEGKIRTNLTVEEGGSPGVGLWNAKGFSVWRAP